MSFLSHFIFVEMQNDRRLFLAAAAVLILFTIYFFAVNNNGKGQKNEGNDIDVKTSVQRGREDDVVVKEVSGKPCSPKIEYERFCELVRTCYSLSFAPSLRLGLLKSSKKPPRSRMSPRFAQRRRSRSFRAPRASWCQSIRQTSSSIPLSPVLQRSV